MAEALELSGNIVTIPVKDKANGWEPSLEETYPLIYDGVMTALKHACHATPVGIKPPYNFSMELCEGFIFDTSTDISWKGTVGTTQAEWMAPSVEIGLEIFGYVRTLLRKHQ
ncbi:MAG: hypothetical protein FWC92_09440 [Defluviitaleaceae bacterium]|nr:hypothetical protein [Defluviitaleaceae bacterium]